MRLTPGLAGGGHHVLGGAAFLGGEVLLEAHRVHQVIDDVDIVERRVQRRRVAEVALGDLDAIAPRHRRELVGVAGQRPHREAVLQQSWHQTSADITRRPGHQATKPLIRHAHSPILRPSLNRC